MDSENTEWDKMFGYELTVEDEPLLRAAKALLKKIIHADQTKPAEVVSVAKLLHALTRLPSVTEDLDVFVSVDSPERKFGEITTSHWWSVALESGTLSLKSGGHFYRPSTGGDSFATMKWEVYPGGAADFYDYRQYLQIVPDVFTYEKGVAGINFAEGGFSVTVNDHENRLLNHGEEDE